MFTLAHNTHPTPAIAIHVFTQCIEFTSLRRNSRRFHDAHPRLHVLTYGRSKFFGRAADDFSAVLVETVTHVSRFPNALEPAVQFFHDGGRHAAGAHQTIPGTN